MTGKQFTGFALTKDRTYDLQTDDILEILLGKYLYEIEFEPDATSGTSPQRTASEIVAPPVTTAKGTNGVWKSVDDGKMLIFTPDNVKASSKVKIEYPPVTDVLSNNLVFDTSHQIDCRL